LASGITNSSEWDAQCGNAGAVCQEPTGFRDRNPNIQFVAFDSRFYKQSERRFAHHLHNAMPVGLIPDFPYQTPNPPKPQGQLGSVPN